jgi:hypothetical protein
VIAALALLLAAADPCAPVEPLPGAEPATAAPYVAVALQEELRGSPDTAVTAWREALRRAPHDTTAASALATLCARAQREALFAEGLRSMDAGAHRAAAEVFARLRAEAPDPGAALLEGICRYELGEDAAARVLLQEASRAPQHEGAASLFLGLLALREGGDAAPFLVRAGTAPALANASAGLLELSRRSGRLVLSALVSGGGDSNESLAPDGSPAPAGNADASASAAGSLSWRPAGESGLQARLSGSYRKLARFTEYDLGLAEGSLGWQLGAGPRHLRADYTYDFLGVGGAAFLSAHKLSLEGRLPLGPLSLSGGYGARFETYLPAASADYSGVRHSADLAASWRGESGLALSLGWLLTRDLARDPLLSHLEQGPRVQALVPLARGARLTAEASLLWRGYDGADPSLGVSRADRYLDLGLLGELDLGALWTARLTVSARSASSNVAAFTYQQAGVALGLAYMVGLL